MSGADLVFLRKLIGSDSNLLGEEVTGATPDLKWGFTVQPWVSATTERKKERERAHDAKR